MRSGPFVRLPHVETGLLYARFVCVCIQSIRYHVVVVVVVVVVVCCLIVVC
jgi:hypothetical protein